MDIYKIYCTEESVNQPLMSLLIAVWLLRCVLVHSSMVLAVKTTIDDNTTRPDHLKLGQRLKVATWNCGGLTFTQKHLCQELGYDLLALTETHDKGGLESSRNYVQSEPAPTDDSFAGVALLLSDRVTKCVMQSGAYGPRIVYARIRSSPCK